MKAITLEQPFASLISIGAKTMETRPWYTDYRGPLAIHAENSATAVTDPYHRSLLASAGLDCDRLPLGKIVAIVRLANCEKVVQSNIPCYPQLAFSDFTPDWYVWQLADICPLAMPIPAKGAKGYDQLWDWEEQLSGELFLNGIPDYL